MSIDVRKASASELGRAIGAGRVDPRDVTEAFLDAIEHHPDATRIYSAVTSDRARAEADAAALRAKQGLRHGPLDGVPLSWKDLFDSAGTETCAGSRLLTGRVPDEDAEVLARASRAGAVCLGKTHMSELAFSGLGLNPMTETPPNIHDPNLVPGGSSSGAATSVAFGLAPAGIGSDTGGSVRIPAAWNDLVGLKTTSGRVSTMGAVPLCEKFDTVGPIARTVEDCAALLAMMDGSKPADLRGVDLKTARFLVLDTYTDDAREAPAKGFAEALDQLGKAGADITHGTVDGIEQAMDLSGILFTSEAYGIWKNLIESEPEKMFDRILDRFRSGAGYAAADYISAWRFLEFLRVGWHQQTAEYDAVLLPTAPILPPDAARLMTDDDYYVTENLLALRNTRVGNLMGLCGLSLPTGTPAAGLMMLGKPGREEALLRVGAAAEAVLS